MSTRFSTDHTWARLDADGLVTVGITPHAQETLGDIVYVELPQAGAEVALGTPAGVVESIKAASDVICPVSGVVVEANASVQGDPALANASPLELGWFFRVRPSKPDELDGLLDEAAYQAGL